MARLSCCLISVAIAFCLGDYAFYRSFGTLDGSTLMEGTEQINFCALVAGQVEMDLKTQHRKQIVPLYKIAFDFYYATVFIPAGIWCNGNVIFSVSKIHEATFNFTKFQHCSNCTVLI